MPWTAEFVKDEGLADDVGTITVNWWVASPDTILFRYTERANFTKAKASDIAAFRTRAEAARDDFLRRRNTDEPAVATRLTTAMNAVI